jgi:hypothetical protein
VCIHCEQPLCGRLVRTLLSIVLAAAASACLQGRPPLTPGNIAPCAQAASGDVDWSASLLLRLAARLSAQCYSQCRACRCPLSSTRPNNGLGSSISQQCSANVAAPPRRGAYTPTLLCRAGTHIHRRRVPGARRAAARGRLRRDGRRARRAAQRGPCSGGPAALWARAGLLPAAGADPAACIAEAVQHAPRLAAHFPPSFLAAGANLQSRQRARPLWRRDTGGEVTVSSVLTARRPFAGQAAFACCTPAGPAPAPHCPRPIGGRPGRPERGRAARRRSGAGRSSTARSWPARRCRRWSG